MGIQGPNGKIKKALKMIVQFNLPENTAPEKYIHSLLSSMDDSHECVACAKNITSVDDKHGWWESYVSSVYEWIKRKKDEIELVCIGE